MSQRLFEAIGLLNDGLNQTDTVHRRKVLRSTVVR